MSGVEQVAKKARIPDYWSRWKAGGLSTEHCPIRQILDRLFGKWPVLVLILLNGRPHRFGELARTLPGISRRVLSQTLRLLEEDRLIERRTLDTRPAGVEYSLSDLGRSFVPTLVPIFEWATALESEYLDRMKLPAGQDMTQ
jgi:DNA-binding HxlR family transcriptional regulator